MFVICDCYFKVSRTLPESSGEGGHFVSEPEPHLPEDCATEDSSSSFSISQNEAKVCGWPPLYSQETHPDKRWYHARPDVQLGSLTPALGRGAHS